MGKSEWKIGNEVLIPGMVTDVSPDNEWVEVDVSHTDGNKTARVFLFPVDLLPLPDPDAPTVEDVADAGVEEVMTYCQPSWRANKDDCVRLRDRIVDRAHQLRAKREAEDER